MPRCKVVSAYVPLDVKHLTREQYKSYGERLRAAVGWSRSVVFDDYPISNCWLYQHLWKVTGGQPLIYPPASAVSPDRYATPARMVESNIVQHQRTSWMVQAAKADPEVEVWIWLDLAIMKQGDWTGKPVTADVVDAFVERVSRAEFDDIPFPGIWDRGPISDTGDNWRFCGSTHIIPRKHLFLVDEFYRYECRKFIERTKTVPLDLPIWAATEANSTLPFRWYKANHDATQLTEFPHRAKPYVVIKDYVGSDTPHECVIKPGATRCDICFGEAT